MAVMSRTPGEWEAVHTVHDYYDRPLTGVADLGGKPHAYSRIFDDEVDDWTDEYWLSPIADEQLRLIKEDLARVAKVGRWFLREHFRSSRCPSGAGRGSTGI